MALPTETLTVIKNGRIVGDLDMQNNQLINLDASNIPGGSGNDTGTTVALLKGDGNHGFADAVAETDYSTPAALLTKEPLLPTTTFDHYLLARRNIANGSAWDFVDPASIVGSNPGSSTAILKGDGAGGFDDAVANTDYTTPAALSSGLGTKEPTLPTTANEGYVLARHTAGAWFFVDPVTLGSTNATYNDGATHGSTTFDSTLAGFTTNDVNKTIVSAGNIAPGTTITSVTGGGTTVILSAAALTTASPVTFTIINRYLAAGSGGTVTNVAVNNPTSTNVSDLLLTSVNNPTTSAEIVISKPTNTPSKTFYGNASGVPALANFMNQAAAFNALDITTAGKNIAQLPNPNPVAGTTVFVGLQNPGNVAVARTPSQVLGDVGAEGALTFISPLARGASPNQQTISVATAAATPAPNGTTGVITGLDYIDFKSRVPATRTLTTTAPLRISNNSSVQVSGTAVDLSGNRLLDMPKASSAADGYLAASDFAKFNTTAGSSITTGQTSGTLTIDPSAVPPVTKVYLAAALTGTLDIVLPTATPATAANISIEIIDIVTGGATAAPAALVTVSRSGSDSVDGANTITLPKGSTYQRFFPNANNKWFSTKYFVDSFKDPTTPTKKASVDVSGLTPSASRTFKIADAITSVSAIPFDPIGPSVAVPNAPRQFLTGLNGTVGNALFPIGTGIGAFASSTISATDIQTNEATVGDADATVTPNDGTLASVRLKTTSDAALTGIRSYTFPNVALYSPGETVRFYDASGCVNTTNFARIISGTGNKFNGNTAIDITEPFFNRVFVADPVGLNWTVSTFGGTSGSGLTLDIWHPVTPSGGIAQLTCSANVVENHHVVTMSANVILAMAGVIPSGATGRIKFRDATGGHTVTVPNNIGRTPTAGGVGVFTTSTGTNIEDEYGWDSDGSNINYYPLGLKMAGAAAATTFTTTADDTTGLSTSGQFFQAEGTNSIYVATKLIANGGVAAGNPYVIGKIGLRLYRTGTPTYSLRCEIHDDNGASAPTTTLLPGSRASDAIAASSLGTSVAQVDFNTAATLVSGNTYWIVLYGDTSGTTAGPYTDGQTDMATNAVGPPASSIFTSLSQAAFVSTDAGKIIVGAGVPSNTSITSVTDGQHVVLNKQVTATATGVSFTILNRYYVNWDYHTQATTNIYRAPLAGTPFTLAQNNRQAKYITYKAP